jgi:hypothetical protein
MVDFMIMPSAPNPPRDALSDPLPGLIASQVLRIEVLRAQAQAFQALAEVIAREGAKPTPVPQASSYPELVEDIPA